MNIKIFILLSLVSLVHLHNLEDTWTLRTSEIPILQSLKTPIYFQFARSLSGDGKNIVGYLTITACNILSYNYNVTDSQIFLYFVSKGRTTRTCLNGEITYLRSKLDQIFYFYIMYNTLLLMPGNNDSPIKLDIVGSSSVPTINGIWTVTDPSSGSKVGNGSVVINGTQMAFCQGSQLINYNLTSNVKINLTNVKNSSGCNDNLINIFTSSSIFVKVNRVDNPQTVTFYNDQVKPVLKLTFQAAFMFNKFAVLNQASLNAITTKTTAASSSNGSSSSLANNSSNVTIINSQHNINKTVTNTTTQVNASLNTTDNSTSAKTANQASNSNATASSNINANNTNTSVPTNNTSTPKNISASATTTTTSSLPVLVSQTSQVFGIWYPSSSLIPSSLTANLLKYQLIINTARLMLSGGCNTIFSTYTFSSGSFKPNNIISTSNSCPNSQDSIIKDIIFNQSNLYYYSGSGSSAKLTINSPQNATLLLLTQTAPS